MRFLFLALSFFLLALGQPDLSTIASSLVSCIALALLWKGLKSFSSRKSQFFISGIIFSFASLIHISWFASDQYVGPIIYLFLFIWVSLLGLIFALFTLWVLNEERLGIWKILSISGLWAIQEWGRLSILTGYTFDPIGLNLTSTLISLQMISLVGIYGLSFWVILTNLLVFKALTQWNLKNVTLGALIALFPYFFGYGALLYHSHQISKENRFLNVLLIQSALSPDEKMRIAPLEQARRMLYLIAEKFDQKIDLILFSESQLPYGIDAPIYKKRELKKLFEEAWGRKILLPESRRSTNGDFARAIASALNCDVLMGLDDLREVPYNAAFLFNSKGERKRYEKQVLVPFGEYIPFSFCRKFLKEHYGIIDSFAKGSEASLLPSQVLIGTTICYEETFGEIVRKSRLRGASLLANISNDGWYPFSRLPIVHFHHGRLRAVELGLPLIRSCNTGVTAAIDSRGKTLAMLPYETRDSPSLPASLYVNLPLYSYQTLYMYVGDKLVICASLAFCFLYFLFEITKLIRPLAEKKRVD